MISGFRVEGLTQLRAAVRVAGNQDLKRALREANKAAAERVVTAALPQVPVLTGRLKQSVRPSGTQQHGRAVAGTAAVPYAAAIHWGTGPRPGLRGPHNIRPRPFLHDAAQTLRPQIAAEYARRIDRILDRIRR